mmetsp:Transcript_116126/g.369525  ORF Transcript_116126/g.369525 Transcript_116126/m.369525 type:complete len:237 (-) Transcript_116126:881-1591(-)
MRQAGPREPRLHLQALLPLLGAGPRAQRLQEEDGVVCELPDAGAPASQVSLDRVQEGLCGCLQGVDRLPLRALLGGGPHHLRWAARRLPASAAAVLTAAPGVTVAIAAAGRLRVVVGSVVGGCVAGPAPGAGHYELAGDDGKGASADIIVKIGGSSGCCGVSRPASAADGLPGVRAQRFASRPQARVASGGRRRREWGPGLGQPSGEAWAEAAPPPRSSGATDATDAKRWRVRPRR